LWGVRRKDSEGGEKKRLVSGGLEGGRGKRRRGREIELEESGINREELRGARVGGGEEVARWGGW